MVDPQRLSIRQFLGVNEGIDPADLPDGAAQGVICQGFSPLSEPGALTKMPGASVSYTNQAAVSEPWEFYECVGGWIPLDIGGISGINRVRYVDGASPKIFAVVAPVIKGNDQAAHLWLVTPTSGTIVPTYHLDMQAHDNAGTRHYGGWVQSGIEVSCDVDTVNQKVYVFVISYANDGGSYYFASLFEYDIATSTWTLLQEIDESVGGILMTAGCHINFDAGFLHCLYVNNANDLRYWKWDIAGATLAQNKTEVETIDEVRGFPASTTGSIDIWVRKGTTILSHRGYSGSLSLTTEISNASSLIAIAGYDTVLPGNYMILYKDSVSGTVKAKGSSVGTITDSGRTDIVDFYIKYDNKQINFIYKSGLKLFRKVMIHGTSTTFTSQIAEYDQISLGMVGVEHYRAENDRATYGVVVENKSPGDEFNAYAIDGSIIEFKNLINYEVTNPNGTELMVVDASHSSGRYLFKWNGISWEKLGWPNFTLEIHPNCDKARFHVLNDTLRAGLGSGRSDPSDARWDPQLYNYIDRELSNRNAFWMGPQYTIPSALESYSAWRLSKIRIAAEVTSVAKPITDLTTIKYIPLVIPTGYSGSTPTYDPIKTDRAKNGYYCVILQDKFGNLSRPFYFDDPPSTHFYDTDYRASRIKLIICDADGTNTDFENGNRIGEFVEKIHIFRADSDDEYSNPDTKSFYLLQTILLSGPPQRLFNTADVSIHSGVSGSGTFTGTLIGSYGFGLSFGAGVAFDNDCLEGLAIIKTYDHGTTTKLDEKTVSDIIDSVVGGTGSTTVVYNLIGTADLETNDAFYFAPGIKVFGNYAYLTTIDWGFDITDQHTIETFTGSSPISSFYKHEPGSIQEYRFKQVLTVSNRPFYIDSIFDPGKIFSNKISDLRTVLWANAFLGIQPDTIKSTNVWFTSKNITGACAVSDRLVVFWRDGFTVGIVNGTEENWQFEESFDGPGNRAFDSIVTIDGVIYHLSTDGFRATTVDGNSKIISGPIKDSLAALLSSQLDAMHGEFYEFENEAKAAVWFTPGSAYAYIYFPETGIWITYAHPFGAIESARGINGELFLLNTTTIVKMFDGTAFPSSYLAPQFKTKIMDMGIADLLKEFEGFEIEYKSNTPINVDVTIGYLDPSTGAIVTNTTSHSIASSASSRRRFRKGLPFGTIGLYIQLSVNIPTGNQAANTDLVIYSLGVEWSPTYEFR